MTIDQLINSLKVYPPDTKVILSRDAEGNGFRPLADYSEEVWDGLYREIVEISDIPIGSLQTVIVLWPED
jgi:hypothetical protein